MAVVPVISNYFFMEVLGGIQDKLTELGYELTIFNVTAGDQLFEEVEHVLKRRWAEGYLFISIHLNDSQWEKLKRFDLPITLIDEHYEGFDSVSVDNVQGAYRATKSLIEKGFKGLLCFRLYKRQNQFAIDWLDIRKHWKKVDYHSVISM